jgi:hypothetical protein
MINFHVDSIDTQNPFFDLANLVLLRLQCSLADAIAHLG